MIIERVAAIHLIPPRTVVTEVPIVRRARTMDPIRAAGSHERQFSVGTDGSILDVTYDDVETGMYSPRDLIAYEHRTYTVPR